MDFIHFYHVNLGSLAINLQTPKTEFYSRILITYLKHSVICIFNENKEEYNAKRSENDVKYSSLNMGQIDKSRELYSKEGDHSSRFEGKTVPWEHTISYKCDLIQKWLINNSASKYIFKYISAWGGCWFVVYIGRFIYKFLNVCPFD